MGEPGASEKPKVPVRDRGRLLQSNPGESGGMREAAPPRTSTLVRCFAALTPPSLLAEIGPRNPRSTRRVGTASISLLLNSLPGCNVRTVSARWVDDSC